MVKHGTGNWQTRHATLEARRRAAKSRRQQADDAQRHRQRVQGSLAEAATAAKLREEEEEEESSSRDTLRLLVWVDVKPLDDDDEGCEDASSHRPSRTRAVSFGESTAATTTTTTTTSSPRGRRGRSQSWGEAKVHPRSKRRQRRRIPSPPARETVWMCRSHFFTGRCGGSDSGGGRRRNRRACPHEHCALPLSRCILRQEDDAQLQRLARSRRSVTAPEEAQQRSGGGATCMPALYPLECLLGRLQVVKDMAEWLWQNDLKYANVIYMAHQGTIIFDAHHHHHHEQQEHPQDEGRATTRSESSDHASAVLLAPRGDDDHVTTSLPIILWEHILLFLPDEAVATLVRVCRRFHGELTASPGLWKRLLQRNRWPSSDRKGEEEEEKERSDSQPDRQAFVRHYSVVRNQRALRRGLQTLSAGATTTAAGGGGSGSTEFSVHTGNTALDIMEPWSANRVLAGHGESCVLRLYETVTKADGSGAKHCRALLQQSFDVYPHTRRRHCRIQTVALDDVCVAALCPVDDVEDGEMRNLLVWMSRDDFLTHEPSSAGSRNGNDENVLQWIDAEVTLLQHLIALTQSHEEEERNLISPRFREFLADGGALDDINVGVYPTLAACGSQHWMLEAMVVCRTDDDDDDEFMDKRLFVISTVSRTVVWMGDSFAHAPLSRGPFTMGRVLTARSSTGCSVLFADEFTISFGHCEISSDGSFVMRKSPQDIDSVNLLDRRLEQQGVTAGERNVAMTRRHLVTSETIISRDDNGDPLSAAFVTIHPLPLLTVSEADRPSDYAKVVLPQVFRTHRLVVLEDEDYVGLLCETDGTDDRHVSVLLYYTVVILHLDTAREIARVPFPTTDTSSSSSSSIQRPRAPLPNIVTTSTASSSSSSPSQCDVRKRTVCLGMDHRGLVMAGQSVREAPPDTSMRTMRKRPKARRRQNGKRKDGFQRGKCLFG